MVTKNSYNVKQPYQRVIGYISVRVRVRDNKGLSCDSGRGDNFLGGMSVTLLALPQHVSHSDPVSILLQLQWQVLQS